MRQGLSLCHPCAAHLVDQAKITLQESTSQTEHFEKCANRTLSGLCGCEVVVLLNFVHHHIWILFGRCFQCQWIFGCASQVDAVASTLTQVFGCLALSFGLRLHLKSAHGVSENSFSFVVVVDLATWHKTSGYPPTVSSVRICQAVCRLNLLSTLRTLAHSVASSCERFVLQTIITVKETRKGLPLDVFEANDGT